MTRLAKALCALCALMLCAPWTAARADDTAQAAQLLQTYAQAVLIPLHGDATLGEFAFPSGYEFDYHDASEHMGIVSCYVEDFDGDRQAELLVLGLSRKPGINGQTCNTLWFSYYEAVGGQVIPMLEESVIDKEVFNGYARAYAVEVFTNHFAGAVHLCFRVTDNGKQNGGRKTTATSYLLSEDGPTLLLSQINGSEGSNFDYFATEGILMGNMRLFPMPGDVWTYEYAEGSQPIPPWADPMALLNWPVQDWYDLYYPSPQYRTDLLRITESHPYLDTYANGVPVIGSVTPYPDAFAQRPPLADPRARTPLYLGETALLMRPGDTVDLPLLGGSPAATPYASYFSVDNQEAVSVAHRADPDRSVYTITAHKDGVSRLVVPDAQSGGLMACTITVDWSITKRRGLIVNNAVYAVESSQYGSVWRWMQQLNTESKIKSTAYQATSGMQALFERYGPAECRVMDNPSADDFMGQLHALGTEPSLQKDDVLILYITSHSAYNRENGSFSLKMTDGYDIPYETLREDLLDIPCNVVLLLEACYAGNVVDMAWFFPEAVIPQRNNLLVLAACHPEETSVSSKVDGAYRSWFTTGILNAMAMENGTIAADADHDGSVTLHELYAYVDAYVDEVSEGLATQTVMVYPLLSDFVVFQSEIDPDSAASW